MCIFQVICLLLLSLQRITADTVRSCRHIYNFVYWGINAIAVFVAITCTSKSSFCFYKRCSAAWLEGNNYAKDPTTSGLHNKVHKCQGMASKDKLALIIEYFHITAIATSAHTDSFLLYNVYHTLQLKLKVSTLGLRVVTPAVPLELVYSLLVWWQELWECC